MKRLLIVLPLFGIMFLNQPVLADLYQQGINAYHNKNYKSAEYYFREVLKTTPGNAKYRYYLAITLAQQGKIFEAESEYKKVIELDPYSEAAEKSRRGLKLITEAKDKIEYDNQPTAMTSVLVSPRRVVVPITKSNNAIIVPNVIINNKLGVNFILDTGATYTSISKKTATDLGLDLSNASKVSLKTANGVIQVPKIILKVVNINGIIANNVEVTIHDLPAAKNVTGLLGLSFLEQFTVTIDRKNSKIILESI